MAKERGVALGIAGFTLGIVSLAILVFNPLFGTLASIVGLILCIIQQKRNKTKFGKIGIIINIIGFVLNTVIFYIYVTAVYDYLSTLSFPTD
ncbi:MAG: hypothetical protein ABIH65_01920 [Nanoarchaeota archaeon]